MSARILLAGAHSSVGKTSVALGLLAAWRRQGLRPAPFKAGPDYIDPGLHAQAAGRPSRNLDVWLQDERALRGVFRRGTRDAGVAVIEGMIGTAAALVLGCQLVKPAVRLAGVVLNRVGNDGHLRSTAEAIAETTGLPVLGSLPNDASVALPERHLGLVPAAEGGVPAASLERLAELVVRRFDLPQLSRIAASAPPLSPETLM